MKIKFLKIIVHTLTALVLFIINSGVKKELILTENSISSLLEYNMHACAFALSSLLKCTHTLNLFKSCSFP